MERIRGGAPRSSIFHTVAWLEALRRTYGYQPIAYTTSAPGRRLEDGLAFCLVASWITGRRLVSLPFSDHCEPLIEGTGDEETFAAAIARTLREDKLRCVEIRTAQDLRGMACLSPSTRTFCFHRLDLRPDLDTLFRNCHKSSTQRKILRGEREKLICETGRSPALLDAFYDLLVTTRRRHRIPPQPKEWFRNLIDCFGDKLQIRLTFKAKRPVASILTLRHKGTLVYKYGCSDVRFNNLGGTQLLFWRAIQEGKSEGLQIFDLGRSEWDNVGLLIFKDRWGTARSTLSYLQFTVSPRSDTFKFIGADRVSRFGKRMMPYLPRCVLRAIGSAVYRHIA